MEHTPSRDWKGGRSVQVLGNFLISFLLKYSLHTVKRPNPKCIKLSEIFLKVKMSHKIK